MAVVEIKVGSLHELIERVLSLRSSLPNEHFLWYRGVGCGEYRTLPKLMRDEKNWDLVTERERRLLTRFRQRSLAYWKEGYPQSEWEHLFAMQHYGVPTRLLDWSENLLVAAYFSLLPSNRSHKHEGSCIPIILCIDPVSWNRSMPTLADYGDAIRILTTADDDLEAYRPGTTKKPLRSPVAMFGAHNSDRIVAQRGTFMVWGSEPKPLEHFATSHSADLWRISFTSDREALFRDLQMLGVSETMVFPELSSLADELARTEGWR